MNWELRTERLGLRRFGSEDAHLLTELDSDPEVLRYIDGGRPPNPELDRQAIERFLEQYRTHPGFGFLAAHRLQDGQYLGWFHFRPDRHDPQAVDLGYRLRRSAWGQGLATEGSRALLRRGFACQGVKRVVAYCLQANRASWRVMEKLGMQRVGEFEETRFPGADRRAYQYALEPYSKVCVDVHYQDSGARTGLLGFREWEDALPIHRSLHHCSTVADYQSGQFYLRELPALRQALEELSVVPQLVVVDGYCWLGPERPGLGAHLHQACGLPVIGVAKNPFRAWPGRPVLRGSSQTPLYLTCCGLEEDLAAEGLRRMHGPHRLPTLLKAVDRLARDGR